MNSPCLECTRVRNPQDCENKGCKDWQAWFIDRWEAMRRNVREQMEERTPQEIGVPLGGEHYAHPHRIREYLQQDPCASCLCPKDVCHAPCPARITWAEKQGEVTK